MNNKRKGYVRKNGFKIFSSVFSLLIVALCAIPLIWMVVSSFKLDREVWAYPFKFFPKRWITNNYVTLFTTKRVNFTQAVGNTLFVAVTHTFLSLAIETMAAYCYARLEFRFKKLLWRVTLFTMFIPNIAILLTSFVVVKELGLLDSLWVCIIPSLAGAGSIFFYRQFFLQVPLSMEEAALVDGASRFRIYCSVFLPNAKAPMVLLGTGTFIGCWNSYVWPTLTLSSVDKWQIMQVIRSFRSTYSESYGVVMAASVLSAIPPLIVFLVFQKHIIKGMLISGIK
jgi:multiple sugar transport system permease protein